MEIFDQFGSIKTVTPGKTLSFTGSDIKDGVTRYMLNLTKTAGAFDLSKVNRLRVKSSGKTQIDCTVAFWRSFMSRMAFNRFAPASNGTTITLFGDMKDADLEPLDLPGANPAAVGAARGGAMAFDSGFEIGGAAVEVDVDATADASGKVEVTWSRPEPVTYKVTHDYLAEAANIPNNSPGSKYDIVRDGYLRGFTIPTTGLDRLELYVRGQQIINLPGWALIEAEDTENDESSPIVDPLTVRLREPLLLGKGSYFKCYTNIAGTWAGATNEIGLYIMRDRQDVLAASNKAGN